LLSAGVLKTVTFIFVSPLLGFLLGSLMMVLVANLFKRTRPSKVDKWFRRFQLVSAGAYSLGHGGNDAQKTIGIIWMLLVATGYVSASETSPPTWTIVSCYLAIGFGTMFGGWRIVKTMGQKITKLKPVGGFCAETGGALTLFFGYFFGHSCLHNPHHHRCHCGCWLYPARQCCSVGGCGQHCVGLDFDHPSQRLCGRHCILAQFANFLSPRGHALSRCP